MKKRYSNVLLGVSALLACGFLFSSCSDDNPGPSGDGEDCKAYPSCASIPVCMNDPVCFCQDPEKSEDSACKGDDGPGDEVDCTDKANCSKAECASSPICKPEVGDKCDTSDQNADSDKDGLVNSTESNIGLDPCNPDSDGDGLLDGDEISMGTDPKNGSDPKKEEVGVRKEICTNSKMLEGGSEFDFAKSRIVRFNGMNYQKTSGGDAVYFDDDENYVYGFVTSSDKSESAKLIMSLMAGIEGVSVVEDSNFTSNVPLESWSTKGNYEHEKQGVPDHTVQRLRYSISIPPMSVKTLRNKFLGAYRNDSALAAETGSDVCDSGVKAALVRSLHADGTDNIFSFVVACDSVAGTAAASALFEDVLSGTMVAPDTYKPFRKYLCEVLNIGAASGMIDFLWVVDNSGSMKDEQENLSSTIAEFTNQLKSSGIDWRLGVTTTDAYTLDEEPNYYPVADPNGREGYLSQDTGLRFAQVAGALKPIMMQLKHQQAMKMAVTKAGNICNSMDDANICGLGLEDGLASGLAALRRLSMYECSENESAADCAGKKLREGAINYVVWLSDEENRQFKEESTTFTSNEVKNKVCRSGLTIRGESGNYTQDTRYVSDEATPCAPSLIEAQKTILAETEPQAMNLDQIREVAGEEYARSIQYYVEAYQKYDAVAFALVGDVGKERGGFCEELGDANQKDAVGAEYGLSYILAARLISGTNPQRDNKEGGFGSVCNTAYSTTVSAILQDAIGRVSNYTLQGYPISSTIRVAVTTKDGTTTELKRSSVKGWQYDASQNAIVLYGTQDLGIEPGNPMAISYVVWERNAG